MELMSISIEEPIVKGIGVVAAATIGAFGTWAGGKLLGKAAFRKAIDEGWEKLAEQQRHEQEDLREEREALRAEVKELRIGLETANAERVILRGEIMNLTQVCSSLEELLRRAGVDVPRRAYPPIVFSQNGQG